MDLNIRPAVSPFDHKDYDKLKEGATQLQNSAALLTHLVWDG